MALNCRVDPTTRVLHETREERNYEKESGCENCLEDFVQLKDESIHIGTIRQPFSTFQRAVCTEPGL